MNIKRFLRECKVERWSDGDTNEQQCIIFLGVKNSVTAEKRIDIIVEFINAAVKTTEMKRWMKNREKEG